MDFLFVLVTSCYPNWQNVINRQPVYNQKTQTVLRICGDRKRFQFNQWKKNMTPSSNYFFPPKSPAGKSIILVNKGLFLIATVDGSEIRPTS